MSLSRNTLSGGIQSWLLKRLERLINEFPGFPTLFFGLQETQFSYVHKSIENEISKENLHH